MQFVTQGTTPKPPRFHQTVSSFPLSKTRGGIAFPHERLANRLDDTIGCPASTIFAGWRQSVLPVHLLGVAPLLGCVGAVAGDVKLQDDGVMDHPVDCRGGGHGVGEDAFPLREDQV